MNNKANMFKPVTGLLIILDCIVWYFIFFPNPGRAELYFLNVGQGDSSLAVLPGSSSFVKFLIDGGPLNGNLGGNLDKVLRAGDRYIDLVFISHPQVDHFGGLIGILKNYKIGAVLHNGEAGSGANWEELEKIISQKGIAKIALGAEDEISYASSAATVLNSSGLSANANDSGLALLLESGGLRALFTADLSAAAEKAMAYAADVKADVLKISHHGSKYSSDLSFLEKVAPKVSVIEVGKNSYGHPAKEVLERLSEIGSKVFRTDKEGIIKITHTPTELKIFNIPN